MNPYDHDPELDPTLRSALDQHARGAGRTDGDINGVWARVEHRRRRRRSVAVFGSLAVVAAGVIGVAAVAASGGKSTPMAAGGTDLNVSTTIAGSNAWACSNYLSGDGVSDYYESCVPVSWPPTTSPDDMVCVSVPYPPTTDPVATAPPTTPFDTSVPALSSPTTTYPPAVAATTVPGFSQQCYPIAPATTYAVDTTTPIIAVITNPPLTATTAPFGTLPSGEIFPFEQTWVVVAGDSLFAIAENHDITAEALVNYNGWTDGFNHPLLVGDLVLIPPGSRVP